MSAPVREPEGGLVHLGLGFDTREQFMSAALPLVRDALDRGDAVSTMLDRASARALRDAAGRAGPVDRLTDRSPYELRGAALEQLRAVPGWIEPGRRTLVIGEYSDGLSAADCSVVEGGINLVFAGLPLTIVCACNGVSDPELVEAWRGGHPELVHAQDGGTETNTSFRAPADHTPVPAELWGEQALSMTLHDVADLARVRDHVARIAGAAGLHADDTDAAVLAVHEAAVLAVDGDGESLLEIRTSPHGVFSEIRCGSRGVEPGALRYVEEFSTAATLRDDDGGRVVRVLTRR